MSILQAKEMSDTIKKFIETVDNHFIKPKKEEYYNLVRHFKYCKQGIKDINFRKKIRRKILESGFGFGYYIFVNNLKVPFMY
jgi:hypothetical protein